MGLCILSPPQGCSGILGHPHSMSPLDVRTSQSKGMKNGSHPKP